MQSVAQKQNFMQLQQQLQMDENNSKLNVNSGKNSKVKPAESDMSHRRQFSNMDKTVPVQEIQLGQSKKDVEQ